MTRNNIVIHKKLIPESNFNQDMIIRDLSSNWRYFIDDCPKKFYYIDRTPFEDIIILDYDFESSITDTLYDLLEYGYCFVCIHKDSDTKSKNIKFIPIRNYHSYKFNKKEHSISFYNDMYSSTFSLNEIILCDLNDFCNKRKYKELIKKIKYEPVGITTAEKALKTIKKRNFNFLKATKKIGSMITLSQDTTEIYAQYRYLIFLKTKQ